MYRLASVVALFGAIIHGGLFYLGKFGDDVRPMLIFAALYLYMAIFLYARKRSTAWMAFFVGLVGMVVTFLGANNGSVAPNEAFHAASMINFVTAVCAFIILWGAKDEAT